MNKRPVLIISALTLGSLACGIAVAGVSTSALPIGDGKVTTSGAKKGYIFVCQTSNGNAPGAFAKGPWIKSDGTYDLNAKAVVDGAVKWSQAKVSIKVKGKKLKITGNDLPKGATTGNFPIASSDDAYQYDRNPNSIKSASVSLSLNAKPKKAAKASCLPGGPIGIATNGVYIFNGLDAADRDAVANEVQDSCGGHPQQQGNYHYHSIPSCLKSSGVVGYALDGFPILANREGGKSITNDDLDACHGHTGKIRLRGKTVKIYHYHATSEYPYTLGCFKGKAVSIARG
jgi:hypothetical protein